MGCSPAPWPFLLSSLATRGLGLWGRGIWAACEGKAPPSLQLYWVGCLPRGSCPAPLARRFGALFRLSLVWPAAPSPERAAAFTDGPFGRVLWLQADGMALPQGPGELPYSPALMGEGLFGFSPPFVKGGLRGVFLTPGGLTPSPAGGVSCYAFGPWGEPVCTPALFPRLNPAFAKIRGRGLGVSPTHVPL